MKTKNLKATNSRESFYRNT